MNTKSSDKEVTDGQGGKDKPTAVLEVTDPLFGVLTEEQVGINPSTGFFIIAQEVLRSMRLYGAAGYEALPIGC